MTFPSTNAMPTLAEGLRQARDQAAAIKDVSQGFSAKMKAGSVPTSSIFALLDNLVDSKNIFSTAAALSGMDAYAEAQLGASIATDFTAMTNAVNSAIAWIVQNFPKDTDGYLQMATMNSDGTRTERSFTTTQTAGLATLLDAVVATID